MVVEEVTSEQSYKGQPMKYERYKECECKELKRKEARLRTLELPAEFTHCTFENFKLVKKHHTLMFEEIKSYFQHLQSFIHEEKKEKWPNKNSIGMIAELGIQTIKGMPPEKRAEYKEKYNSLGLGKTHLLAASAYSLIKRYNQTVVYARDIDLITELQSIKYADPIKFQKRLEEITRCDFLVWDDLGKSKPSEAREEIYYQIINLRYINKRPILFSSNEDQETLGDVIGYAALDRLIGMCGEFLLVLKGESYRRS